MEFLTRSKYVAIRETIIDQNTVIGSTLQDMRDRRRQLFAGSPLGKLLLVTNQGQKPFFIGLREEEKHDLCDDILKEIEKRKHNNG